MERYITISKHDGSMRAFTERGAWQKHLDNEEWADYIWQFAPDAKTALDQHHSKFDQYTEDINSGLDPKQTY